MKEILNKKTFAWISLALVCVLAGTFIGSGVRASAADETRVVLTSPYTEAIAKVGTATAGTTSTVSRGATSASGTATATDSATGTVTTSPSLPKK